MKKVVNIIGLLGAVFIAVFIVFQVGLNTVENLRLVTGGTVKQGIIWSIGNCSGSRHSPSIPMYVQLTDTHGRQEYVNVEDGCGYIGIPFRHAGDNVSIIYLPDTPNLARIQSDLVLQFWVLEIPLLLVTLLIVFFMLTRLLRRSSNPDNHLT